MSQAKLFSPLTGDVLDLGPATEDLDAILGIAETVATFDPTLIVYVQGPALQKWKDE